MGSSQTGFRSFDETASPLTGWADGDSPCAAALSTPDDARRAALYGTSPTEEATTAGQAATTPTPQPSTDVSQEAWQTLPNWDATGRDAVMITPDARTLILGCTESRELAVALKPAETDVEFLIGGRPARDSGIAGDTAYGLFSGAERDTLGSGASISWQEDGAAFDIPGPAAELLPPEC